MADLRIEKLAQTVVEYSVGVRKGDRVMIDGNSIAEPLINEIYARVLQAGGHPFLMLSLPGTDERFSRYASDDQLKYVAKPTELIYDTYDVRIALLAETNTKALSNVNPDKIVLRRRARTGLQRTFMRRSAAKEMRWTVAPFPTNASAQAAEMSLAEYEDFVYGACLPDMSDPVGYWQRFSTRQQKIVNWLKGKKQVQVTGPDTDLRLSINERIFENCDGHFNMPDGEIFTGPVEDSIEGHVYFSYPTIYSGREVTGVRLWFEKGKVVKASADKNEEFLLKTLDTDAGSRFFGGCGIGATA